LDVRQIVEAVVSSAVRKKLGEWGVDAPVAVSLEIPKQEEHGDFSINAAMQVARHLGRKPRAIADELAVAIREEDRDRRIASVAVAGPGFINIVVSEDAWREILSHAIAEGPRFGSSGAGAVGTVHIEFVSANPTGPLHVGHGRGAAVGDAIARILEFTGTRSSGNIT
jgi:arginyl-tRNA synthetase